MGYAIPCLIRIVAACPRLRLIRVCASYDKTFPGHEAFTSSNPVDEAHVPRTGPGTPQANGHLWSPWTAPPGRRLAHPADRWPHLTAPLPDTPRIKQTHRWPPDGQSAPPGQRCDPAGPAAVARASKRTLGRSVQTPLLWESLATMLPAGEPPGSAKAMTPGAR